MDHPAIKEETNRLGGSETNSTQVDDSGRGGEISTERKHRGSQRKSKVGGWTAEEDAMLEEAVREHRGKNWKMIATKLPGRSQVQCLHRWREVLDPRLYKGAWRKEEDDLIVEQVAKHGQHSWSVISNSLQGRNGKQCRERWNNHLRPGIITTPWTEQEDSILVEVHRELGNKWAELAKLIPGRSENAIKNRWNCTLSKRMNGGNNRKSRRVSEPSHSGDIDPGPSSSVIYDNDGTVMRDLASTSGARDNPNEHATDANPVEETVPVGSSSGLSLDLVSPDVTGYSAPSSTSLPGNRSSLRLSSLMSYLRRAASSYTNIPSIIMRRESRALDTNGQDSKRAAVPGIMLFGKLLEPEFNAAAATAEGEDKVETAAVDPNIIL